VCVFVFCLGLRTCVHACVCVEACLLVGERGGDGDGDDGRLEKNAERRRN